MDSSFFRTRRALGEDRFSLSILGISVGALLLCAWTAWFCLAQVSLFEVSPDARLEVDSQVHLVESPISGQVIAHSLEVGREVHEGDILVELDAHGDQLELEETEAKYRQAQAAAVLSADEARRLVQLVKGGQVAEVESVRARAGAEKSKAAVEALEASISRLKYEIERHRVRAPASGKIGEKLSAIHPGSVIEKGQRLASVVPAGKLRAVAYYSPSSALGRVRPGQPARLRLQGFPWAQYGSLDGIVTSVASEVRDGKIRVEHSIAANPGSRITLQHGLPGTVEIEVERVSPATLVLRAAGALMVRPNSNATSGSASGGFEEHAEAR